MYIFWLYLPHHPLLFLFHSCQILSSPPTLIIYLTHRVIRRLHKCEDRLVQIQRVSNFLECEQLCGLCHWRAWLSFPQQLNCQSLFEEEGASWALPDSRCCFVCFVRLEREECVCACMCVSWMHVEIRVQLVGVDLLPLSSGSQILVISLI